MRALPSNYRKGILPLTCLRRSVRSCGGIKIKYFGKKLPLVKREFSYSKSQAVFLLYSALYPKRMHMRLL